MRILYYILLLIICITTSNKHFTISGLFTVPWIILEHLLSIILELKNAKSALMVGVLGYTVTRLVLHNFIKTIWQRI